MTRHENLVRDAKKAIAAVHSDTSVSLSVTLADLKDLRDDLEVLIDAVESDVARQRKE
jgi:hypothetical protein